GEALRTNDALARGDPVADVPTELAPIFRPSVQPYLMSIMTVDPRLELARLSLPVLLLYGGRDVQVPLEHRDVLARARPDARVVTVPTANHVLKTAPIDPPRNPATHTKPPPPLDSGILPPI